MTSGPAFLGELRDGLLNQVLGLLKADPVVEGVACSFRARPLIWRCP
jgi:hypothetical protein